VTSTRSRGNPTWWSPTTGRPAPDEASWITGQIINTEGGFRRYD
jgi:hypothetical protein